MVLQELMIDVILNSVAKSVVKFSVCLDKTLVAGVIRTKPGRLAKELVHNLAQAEFLIIDRPVLEPSRWRALAR